MNAVMGTFLWVSVAIPREWKETNKKPAVIRVIMGTIFAIIPQEWDLIL